MRGAKGVWIQAGYLLVLTLILTIAYATGRAPWGGPTRPPGYGSAAATWELGQRLFRLLGATQAVLIALIAPALTCGAVSLEREQRTFDLVLATPLSAGRIVLGKLLSAFLFLGVLLVLSLPLASVSFLLGGVSPGELVAVYVSLAAEAALLCAIGLACSAACSGTRMATPLAYAFCLAILTTTAVPPGVTAGLVGHGSPAGDLFVLGGMNAIALPWITAQTTHWFGLTFSVAWPGTLLNLLMAATAVSLAAHHVAVLRAQSHAPAVRVTLALTIVTAFTLVMGHFAHLVSRGGSSSLEGWTGIVGYALAATAALLALLTTTLATNEVGGRESPRRWAGMAVNPLRVLHGHPATAAGYVLLVLALTAPAVAGMIWSLRGIYSAPFGMEQASLQTARASGNPSLLGSATWSATRARLWCAGVAVRWYALVASHLLACVGVGWAATALFRTRWAAAAAATVAVAAGSSVPLYGMLPIAKTHGQSVPATANVLYLSPYFAGAYMLVDDAIHNDGSPVLAPFCLDGSIPFEFVTIALNLSLFVVLSALTFAALRKRARARPPVTVY